MRQKLTILLLLIVFSSHLSGDPRKNENNSCCEPDNLTPSSATLFLTLPDIPKAIKFIKNNRNYFNFIEYFANLYNWIDKLKKKSGIDILNKKNLQKIGIDTERSIYLANLENKKNFQKIILFIPVQQKNNFPIEFVKILTKINKNKKNLDLNPAISSYKGFQVYQILNDIFFTVINNYFILTSSGNILTQIIDFTSPDQNLSLANDISFKNYKTKFESINKSNIVNIYLKRNFLNQFRELYHKNNSKKQKFFNKPVVDQNDEHSFNFNFLSYLAFGFNKIPEKISISSMLSVNEEDSLAKLFMKTFTTGLIDKALFINRPIGYHFFSIDMNKLLNYFNNLPRKNNIIYQTYIGLVKFADKILGVNLNEDFRPYSSSFINIAFKKPKTAEKMDSYIIYMPMKKYEKIEETLEKINSAIKNKYLPTGNYGEENINGVEYFWFRNERDNKIIVLDYENNYYIGNNINLIITSIKVQKKNIFEIKNDFIKKIDKTTFLLSYTKFDDDSFLKAILIMLAYNRHSELYGLVNRIENINLIGNKIENDFYLNLNIKMRQ